MTEKTGSKRWALYAGLLFLLLAVLGYVFRGALLGGLIAWRIGPDHDFTAQAPPSAPDYSNNNHWAALPETANASQYRPAPDQPMQEGHPAPVFFVHPTSYFGKARWNQNLDDPGANWIVDERVLRHQASVFSDCCEVYAPRYRQATFFSFMDNNTNADQALALAYEDIVAAFSNFLSRIPAGEPFILAGHSQGTRHGARLLREQIANTPLQSRLVAAYLVGFSITADDLGGVPVCQHASDTGCALGWNSIDGNGRGLFAGVDNLLCVNPLSWTYDEQYAAHELNSGAIGYASYGPAKDGEDINAMVIEPGAADAQCRNGQLFVPELRTESFPQRMQGGSTHVYDYSLFHMNIRANATERLAAFRKLR